MRTLILSVALCTALAGCKKDPGASAGSAGPTGSAAAVAAGAAVDKALESAGSAAAMAGAAMGVPPDEAAKMAGSAAAMAQAAAAVAGGAGANVPRPAAVTDAHIAVADKVVGMLQKMGAGITAAGSDCKKVASVLETSSKDLEPIKAEAEKLQKLGEGDANVKTWFETTYAPKFLGAMSPLMTAAQTCGSDPDFQKAMEKIDLGN